MSEVKTWCQCFGQYIDPVKCGGCEYLRVDGESDELATLRAQLSAAIGERDRLRAASISAQGFLGRIIDPFNVAERRRVIAEIDAALSTSRKGGTS